jgi:hypothetical protein
MKTGNNDPIPPGFLMHGEYAKIKQEYQGSLLSPLIHKKKLYRRQEHL